MRKTIIICDRCGKEIGHEPTKFSAIVNLDELHRDIDLCDLCDECKKIIFDFVAAFRQEEQSAPAEEVKEQKSDPVKTEMIDALMNQNTPSNLQRQENAAAVEFAAVRAKIRERFKDSGAVFLADMIEICRHELKFKKTEVAEAADLRLTDIGRKHVYPYVRQKISQYYGIKLVD